MDSHQSLLTDTGETSSSHVDVLTLHDSTDIQASTSGQLEVRVAGRRVRFVILETVKVLVALAANLTPVGLLFLHT